MYKYEPPKYLEKEIASRGGYERMNENGLEDQIRLAGEEREARISDAEKYKKVHGDLQKVNQFYYEVDEPASPKPYFCVYGNKSNKLGRRNGRKWEKKEKTNKI